MTEKGLDLNDNGTLKHTVSFKNPDNYPDKFTKAGVGGTHSDFKEIAPDARGNYLMEFTDEQKLNP